MLNCLFNPIIYGQEKLLFPSSFFLSGEKIIRTTASIDFANFSTHSLRKIMRNLGFCYSTKSSDICQNPNVIFFNFWSNLFFLKNFFLHHIRLISGDKVWSCKKMKIKKRSICESWLKKAQRWKMSVNLRLQTL